MRGTCSARARVVVRHRALLGVSRSTKAAKKTGVRTTKARFGRILCSSGARVRGGKTQFAHIVYRRFALPTDMLRNAARPPFEVAKFLRPAAKCCPPRHMPLHMRGDGMVLARLVEDLRRCARPEFNSPSPSVNAFSSSLSFVVVRLPCRSAGPLCYECRNLRGYRCFGIAARSRSNHSRSPMRYGGTLF